MLGKLLLLLLVGGVIWLLARRQGERARFRAEREKESVGGTRERPIDLVRNPKTGAYEPRDGS